MIAHSEKLIADAMQRLNLGTYASRMQRGNQRTGER